MVKSFLQIFLSALEFFTLYFCTIEVQSFPVGGFFSNYFDYYNISNCVRKKVFSY